MNARRAGQSATSTPRSFRSLLPGRTTHAPSRVSSDGFPGATAFVPPLSFRPLSSGVSRHPLPCQSLHVRTNPGRIARSRLARAMHRPDLEVAELENVDRGTKEPYLVRSPLYASFMMVDSSHCSQGLPSVDVQKFTHDIPEKCAFISLILHSNSPGCLMGRTPKV